MSYKPLIFSSLAMDYSHQARGESWNILLVCVSYLYFVIVYKITVMVQFVKHDFGQFHFS